MAIILVLLVLAAVRRMSVRVDAADRFRDFYEFFSAAAVLHAGGSAADVFAAGKLGYIYPPLVAVGLTVLVPLGITAAAVIWAVVGAAALGVSAWLCGRMTARAFGRPAATWPLATVGCLLLMDKLLSEFKMQQSNSLLLLTWVGAMALHRGRPWLAGLCLAVGFNIKYVTVAAVPYLVVRRSLTAAVAACVLTVLVALLPALVIGWERNADLWRGAVRGLVHATGDGGDDSSAEGAARVISMQRLGFSVTSSVLEQAGRLGTPALAAPVVLAAALGVLGACAWMYRRAGLRLFRPDAGLAARDGPASKGAAERLMLIEWSGLIVGVLVFSPQTNPRHLVQVLPALILMAGLVAFGGSAVRRAGVIAIALVVLGMILPPSFGVFREWIPVWHRMGGPSWCLLAGWMLALWAVLEHDRHGGPVGSRDQGAGQLLPSVQAARVA